MPGRKRPKLYFLGLFINFIRPLSDIPGPPLYSLLPYRQEGLLSRRLMRPHGRN